MCTLPNEQTKVVSRWIHKQEFREQVHAMMERHVTARLDDPVNWGIPEYTLPGGNPSGASPVVGLPSPFFRVFHFFSFRRTRWQKRSSWIYTLVLTSPLHVDTVLVVPWRDRLWGGCSEGLERCLHPPPFISFVRACGYPLFSQLASGRYSQGRAHAHIYVCPKESRLYKMSLMLPSATFGKVRYGST